MDAVKGVVVRPIPRPTPLKHLLFFLLFGHIFVLVYFSGVQRELGKPQKSSFLVVRPLRGGEIKVGPLRSIRYFVYKFFCL